MYRLSNINTRLITKIIINAVLVFMLTCSAAITFFMYSNHGFSYLLKIISFYYGTNITIAGSSGALANGITIQNATINEQNATIKLTNIKLTHSLQHIFQLPKIKMEKVLFSYGSMKTTATDIQVEPSGNIKFNVPQYHISGNLKLIKHSSSYDIIASIGTADGELKLLGTTTNQSMTLSSEPNSAIKANIKATWHDILRWDIVAVNSTKSDSLRKLDFYSSGNLDEFVIALNKLEGALATKPINAEVVYKKHPHKQDILANIAYSNNQAEITCSIADDMNIKANINAPDLSVIMPEMLGAITANINISGTTTQPKAKITLNANNIFHRDISLDSLAADISINENANKNIAANIISAGVRYKNIYKKQSKISITGNLANHTIKIISEKGTNSTNFTSMIAGSYIDQAWQGEIVDLVLSDNHSDLKIVNTDNITINKNGIYNKQLCLAHEAQTICTKFKLDPNSSWQAQVKSKDFDLNNLSPLNFLNNLIIVKSGAITSDITLSSDKQRSILQHGYINIKDAKIYLKAQNIYPTISSLNINASNHAANITGEITSENNNQAKISGDIKTKGNLEAKIKIKGDDILLYNTANTKLIASPDVMLALGNSLNITGKVDVNKASFNIQDNDEIKLPNDVVVSDYYSKAKPSFMTLGPKTAIQLNLLDDIAINVQKIYSKITGSLLLNADNDGKVLATGTIKTYAGSFSGYGQKLNIEHGKLIYDKDTLDSPWLNVEATRSINLDNSDDLRDLDKIIVGIIISGHITNPDITLFSKPNRYTENEILSLLLTGSLSSILNNDGELNQESDNFYSLLLGKNLVQSLGVLNKLSDKLSLNQISIGGSISDNQTEVSNKSPINIIMSKDINDNLRLIGTFGIYSEDYSLSAIYNINKNIMLKGYTNQLSRGLNMLYKFHTD